MKKYFKVASESYLGQGDTFFEFDGGIVVRQVEHYGNKWFSSRDEYHEELGPGLCDVPLSQMELYDEDKITSDEFESAWEKASN